MRGGFMLLVKGLLFATLSILTITSVIYFTLWASFGWYQLAYLFSLLGILCVSFAEFRIKKQFLRVMAFLLKVILYITFLIILKWVIIDPVSQFPHIYHAQFITGVNIFSWVIAVTLIGQGVNRFIFYTIEQFIEEKIPKILTGLFYCSLYIGAFSGILAFELQYQITALLTASGLLTIIIGLSIKANLANVFSGIFLSMDRPFQRGDYVHIGEQCGFVKTISWRTTILRKFNKSLVIIPNEVVAQSVIINECPRSNNEPILFVVKDTIYIHPDHDPVYVKSLLMDALEKTIPSDGRSQLGVKAVNLNGLTIHGLEFQIDFDIERRNLLTERNLVYMNVHRTLAEAGIRSTPGRIMHDAKPDRGFEALNVFKEIENDYQNVSVGNCNIYLENLKDSVIMRKLPIFRELSTEMMDQLCENIDRTTFQDGEFIVHQGDPGSSMYVIVDGIVQILIDIDEDKKQVTRLGVLDYFGEMSLMTGEPRTASVVCVGKVVTIKIKKEHMQKIFDQHPGNIKMIAQVMTERTLANQQVIDEEGTKQNVKQHLGKKIMDKMKRFFGLVT